MKKVVLALVAVFALNNMQAVEPLKEGKHNVDAAKSTIEWKGEKVTGEHMGTINISQGNLVVKKGELAGGEFTIDMSSIVVTDLEGEYKGKLEGHLKSDDFFGVANHPKATLVITNTKLVKGNTYEVTADLTIKGITKPIKFMAELVDNNGTVQANANIIVDRSEYDVRYGSGSFFDDLGDKTIYDEFTLTVNLVTK